MTTLSTTPPLAGNDKRSWLRLFGDGRLETGVSRVTGIDFEVDYTIKGY